LDGAREYNAKPSKSVRKGPYDFTHMWNLKRKKKKNKGKKQKRQTKKQTLKL